MSDVLLKSYVSQFTCATIARQGSEFTVICIPFFDRMVEMICNYRRQVMPIHNENSYIGKKYISNSGGV